MKPQRTIDAEGRDCYAYIINHTEITDPYLSECGRFKVLPSHYGLTDAQANLLKELNHHD
jgi:hypothetical protein